MFMPHEKFAGLVTSAIWKIKALTGKNIGIIEDELGFALGKAGRYFIQYIRKGNVPADPDSILNLAKLLVERKGLDLKECIELLASADYPDPEGVATWIFSKVGMELPSSEEELRELSHFVVGVPITHPRQFFGREKELKRIFSHWRKRPKEQVALQGLKRSGKTSLLYYLKEITCKAGVELRPGQKRDWLPNPEEYRWIMVDFQDARFKHRDRLLQHLLEGLNLPVPTPCSLENFMDVVSHSIHTPTIILMDEIRAGLISPELDDPFWESLRSLATHSDGNLGYLITADIPPWQLKIDYGKTSPFFNMFFLEELKPFQESEARELIESSPRPFATEDVEWILEQSGCWPALVQICCWILLYWLEDGQSGNGWREEALRQIEPLSHLTKQTKGCI